MNFISVFLILLSSFAHADTAVMFFGGHGANNIQMENWEKSAQSIKGLNSEFSFRGIPYPSKSPLYQSAIQDGQSQIKALIKEIDDKPTKEIILVAHSSGSALAIEIAKQIKTPNRIKLIILDGFSPSQDLQSRVQTQCWTATAGDNEKIRSINYAGMKKCQSHQEFRPYGCATPMCLHFSLVNLNAKTETINDKNYKETGYKNVFPNLSWLREFSSSNAAAVIPAAAAK